MSSSASSSSSSLLPDPSSCLSYLSSVSPHDEYNSECGYCASTTENRIAYGVSTYRLTCLDYQALIDYGWRRSGNYVYKPTNLSTCCPNLTIRNNVYNFRPSRHQKKLVRNFHRYLRGEINLVGNSEEHDEEGGGEGNTSSFSSISSLAPSVPTSSMSSTIPTALPATTTNTNNTESSSITPPSDEIGSLLSSLLATIVSQLYPSVSIADPRTANSSLVKRWTSFSPTVLSPALSGKVSTPPSTSCSSTTILSSPPSSSSPSLSEPQYTSMLAFHIHGKLFALHGGKKRLRKSTSRTTTTPTTTSTPTDKLTLPPKDKLPTNQAEDGTIIPSPTEIATLLVHEIHTRLTEHSTDYYDISTVPTAGMLHAYASTPVPSTALYFTAASTGHINIYLPFHQLYQPSTNLTLTVPTLPPSSTPSIVVSPSSSSTTNGGSNPKKSRHDPSSPSPLSSSSTVSPPYPTHTFRVDTVPAAFDKEAFDLYCRYQTTVHKDKEVTVKQYTNFLCTSPLLREPRGAPIGTRLGLHPLNASTRNTIETLDQATANLAKSFSLPIDTVRKLLKEKKNDIEATYNHILATIGAHITPVDWESTEGKLIGTACASLRTGWTQGNTDNRTNESLHYPPDVSSSSSSDPFHWVKGFPHDKDYVFTDLLDPLQATQTGTDLSCGYGAFHQRYYLDGKLIAVGVIDILPSCLSSVYLFYDPELSKILPLGKLTALREIQWVQATAARASPRLHWYYLGYVVVSCPKMRYKLDYKPTEILCPYTHNFVPLTDAILHCLDNDKYSVIDTSFVVPPSGATTTIGTNELQTLAKQQYPQYKRLKEAKTIALMNQIPLLLSSPMGVVIDDANNLALCRDINPKVKDRIQKLLKDYLFRLPSSDIAVRLIVRFG